MVVALKKGNDETDKGYESKTINVPDDLMDRVRRCMVLTGLRTFTSFAHSSLTLKCQATEREHGVDAVGTPVRPSKEYPLDRP